VVTSNATAGYSDTLFFFCFINVDAGLIISILLPQTRCLSLGSNGLRLAPVSSLAFEKIASWAFFAIMEVFIPQPVIVFLLQVLHRGRIACGIARVSINVLRPHLI
jgi:hypothetical protein